MASIDNLIEKVAAYESTVKLLTYPIKGENRNPVFRSQYGVAHIYPYTLLDDIASAPVERTYRALILENRYLRVTVIPDLGGRVYSVYDKISHREVFYRNSVVKFSPLAIRGAFFSGGVEFSFPVAHAPTTADPVNWDLRQHEDGSASIAFGGLEHISGLRWMITLTLFPERCALAQDVRLFNPGSLPGRYHYWTNASLEANDQTEFIYPLRRVRSYEFAGTASWPVARLDLIKQQPGLPGMEGVPMWPAERMLEPINFRWQRNMLAQVSIFGREVNWDFFGAWQHSANHGYAHFASHRDVAGMKLWSWGNAGVGVVNQSALTDDGSLYAETQCGAMETQLDFDFLQPGKVRTWREWWLVLRDLGGLTCASADMGARLYLSEGGQTGVVNLTVGVCPVRDLGESRVEVSIPGRELVKEHLILTPERPWLRSYPLIARELADHPIRIRVTDGSGQVVMDYTLDRQPSPVQAAQPESQPQSDAAQELYLLGLKHENFDNREQALHAYRQTLELSPQHAEAHFRLGLMLLRAADFEAARDHFSKSVECGMLDANYYLGQIAWIEEDLNRASQYYLAVAGDSHLSGAALLGLGAIALRTKDWPKAIDWCQQARLKEEHPATASLLLGIALRCAGRTEDAERELERLLEADPLNHPALREMALLRPEGVYRLKLNRLLADDRQYYLDLACYYLSVGLSEDALSVLEEAAEGWHYPMLGYLAAYICERLGRAQAIKTWLDKAAEGSADYVFPSRLAEVLALQWALKQAPQDDKARYYLGNFYYAHERFDDGVRMWQEALPGLNNYDIIYRNLGLAAWQRESNPSKAIELFERALSLNPQNYDLYLHLDDLYKSLGLGEKRHELLERINSLAELREDVRKRRILLMVELGRSEEALQIMQTEKFVPLEMDQSFHNLYVRALMMRAGSRLESGDIEGAIGDYHKALEFPENLGVGEPTTLSQAHIYYQLGLAYEQLGRFREAIGAWRKAASEHHPLGSELFPYVQMALDKLSRYSELGFED